MSLLNIISVNDLHSGQYKCAVHNKNGSASSVARINITGIL